MSLGLKRKCWIDQRLRLHSNSRTMGKMVGKNGLLYALCTCTIKIIIRLYFYQVLP